MDALDGIDGLVSSTGNLECQLSCPLAKIEQISTGEAIRVERELIQIDGASRCKAGDIELENLAA